MTENIAIQTIEIPVQITLPFVIEIAEDTDLKTYISDIWLNGEECLTDSIKPFIDNMTKFKESLFFLYEKERGKQEKELNRKTTETTSTPTINSSLNKA